MTSLLSSSCVWAPRCFLRPLLIARGGPAESASGAPSRSPGRSKRLRPMRSLELQGDRHRERRRAGESGIVGVASRGTNSCIFGQFHRDPGTDEDRNAVQSFATARRPQGGAAPGPAASCVPRFTQANTAAVLRGGAPDGAAPAARGISGKRRGTRVTSSIARRCCSRSSGWLPRLGSPIDPERRPGRTRRGPTALAHRVVQVRATPQLKKRSSVPGWQVVGSRRGPNKRFLTFHTEERP
jgi:hypothetical protein